MGQSKVTKIDEKIRHSLESQLRSRQNEQHQGQNGKNKVEHKTHLRNLKEVNALKPHNVPVDHKGPLIYFSNPVEAKMPKAYMSVPEFKKALRDRVEKLRIESKTKPKKFPATFERFTHAHKPTRTVHNKPNIVGKSRYKPTRKLKKGQTRKSHHHRHRSVHMKKTTVPIKLKGFKFHETLGVNTKPQAGSIEEETTTEMETSEIAIAAATPESTTLEEISESTTTEETSEIMTTENEVTESETTEIRIEKEIININFEQPVSTKKTSETTTSKIITTENDETESETTDIITSKKATENVIKNTISELVERAVSIPNDTTESTTNSKEETFDTDTTTTSNTETTETEAVEIETTPETTSTSTRRTLGRPLVFIG